MEGIKIQGHRRVGLYVARKKSKDGCVMDGWLYVHTYIFLTEVVTAKQEPYVTEGLIL